MFRDSQNVERFANSMFPNSPNVPIQLWSIAKHKTIERLDVDIRSIGFLVQFCSIDFAVGSSENSTYKKMTIINDTKSVSMVHRRSKRSVDYAG